MGIQRGGRQSIRLCICHYRQNDSKAAMQVSGEVDSCRSPNSVIRWEKLLHISFS